MESRIIADAIYTLQGLISEYQKGDEKYKVPEIKKAIEDLIDERNALQKKALDLLTKY